MDSELARAVNQYVNSESFDSDARREIMATIIPAVNANQDMLIKIVVKLEEVLQDKANPNGRKNAVKLLCDCLSSEDSKLALNFKHVQTFALFFCSKLSDWQCVEGAVGGLLALFQRHGPVLRTLRDEDDKPLAIFIARTIFTEVHTPSHTQGVRNVVLVLVTLLLAEWRSEVEVLADALGDGIAATIEEEKDPRNLLLSFRLVERLLQDCSSLCVSAKTLESFFETLTAYFPITFTPPKDDKYGITGEDLRLGLARALSASPRFAEIVVPFFLDSAKDITVGDSEVTIKQALESLSTCLDRYGPDITRKYFVDLLKTAQDQVCRTATPCPAEFANLLRDAFKVLLRDVPIGLQPAWLSRLVDPTLKVMSQDSAKGEASLASGGSRRLLLAAAASHPILLENVWIMTSALLLPKPAEGAPEPVLEQSAVPFLLRMSWLDGKSGSVLRPRQLKPILSASLVVLKTVEASTSSSDEDSDKPMFAVTVELIGRLCQLIGADGSSDAFNELCQILLPSDSGSTWRHSWKTELSAAQGDDLRLLTLVSAIVRVVGEQPARALDLCPVLQRASPHNNLPSMLPQLLVVAACSVARYVVGDIDGDAAKAKEGATALLSQAAAFIISSDVATETADAIALVFEGVADLLPSVLDTTTRVPCKQTVISNLSRAAVSWVASTLAKALELPEKLPRLCGGVSILSLGDASHVMSLHSVAMQRLVQALSDKLPDPDALALRRHVLELAPDASQRACIIFIKSVLPQSALESWELCRRLLPAVQECISDSRYAALEPPALEALEALVESCPADQVENLLDYFRNSFGGLISGRASVDQHSARAAAMSWAVATSGLLKRGGFASQASNFLEALLAALQQDGPVTTFVPLAFRVLMPARFDSKMGAGKLPPLALQQLSRTTLPSLMGRARACASASENLCGKAALESAVSLLCALPPDVSCVDCMDDLRWCALTGLKRINTELAETDSSSEASARSMFAPQLLQLLVRGMRRGTSWVEDDLHSVVPPLMTIGCSHCIPLVRLGCFEALSLLIQEAYGHLTPYKKVIEKATQRGVEDRRREVRLVAVHCLNAWHCGTVTD